ncbi:glycosyltransferase [Candidatus Bipolaricaulota bacterium]|nr:glycosyltransferase [Candidatus Bipolaricaulota bacterium]
MSAVVFPFKREDPDVLLKNVRTALAHPRVRRVVCVGAEEDECFATVARAAPNIARSSGKEVVVIVQERIGTKRPGKGDGMNSALRYLLTNTEHDRIHFYDADILSFSEEWIAKAEEAADQGYQVVRHYFPRASTDAMITWFITRTGFAILFPRSELPRIEQPLGGELLVTRKVAEALLADPRVQAQSDWGIDTLYTFATVAQGFSIYETYMGVGKVHKLYGSLGDLRTMLIECFEALSSLAGASVAGTTLHHVEYQGPVSEAIKAKVGYDVDATLALLAEGWTERQAELLDHFPPEVRDGLNPSRRIPRVGCMDDKAWYDTYRVLLREYQSENPEWQDLLFRLWAARVLAYTFSVALRGYDLAMHHLHQMVECYCRRAAGGS